MKIMHAIKYAYRHTWRSNRLGFFKAIPQGIEVYQAQDEIKLLLFVIPWMGITLYVLSNYKWVV